MKFLTIVTLALIFLSPSYSQAQSDIYYYETVESNGLFGSTTIPPTDSENCKKLIWWVSLDNRLKL
jgi:hypothetical protein